MAVRILCFSGMACTGLEYLQNHGSVYQSANWWLGLGYSDEHLDNFGFVGDIASMHRDRDMFGLKDFYCCLCCLS